MHAQTWVATALMLNHRSPSFMCLPCPPAIHILHLHVHALSSCPVLLPYILYAFAEDQSNPNPPEFVPEDCVVITGVSSTVGSLHSTGKSTEFVAVCPIVLLQKISQTQKLSRAACVFLLFLFVPIPTLVASFQQEPLLPLPRYTALLCPLQRISQTQNPLELPPEVESLRFHEPRAQPPAAAATVAGTNGGRSGSGGSRPWSAGGLAPDVCESFAFQKDAIEFAGWCNGVGPGVVAGLQVRRWFDKAGWVLRFLPAWRCTDNASDLLIDALAWGPGVVPTQRVCWTVYLGRRRGRFWRDSPCRISS